MKFIKHISAILLIAFYVMGCASNTGGTNYSELAKEEPFELFFPSASFKVSFFTIEEAYDYFNKSDKKFAQTVRGLRSGKVRFVGKLTGPMPKDDPVTIVCWVYARDSRGKEVDFSKITEPLETFLKKTNSLDDVVLTYCIFYGDRAVVIPKYFLNQKYSGYTDGSNQIKSYYLGEIYYQADYSLGASIENAFQYLRKERN